MDALASLAVAYAPPKSPLAIAFNARKNEVYLQLFSTATDPVPAPMDEIQAVQKEDIAAYITSDGPRTDNDSRRKAGSMLQI